MRESKFILQNKEKWQKYEEGIRGETLAAEDMERAFVELNDDLAFARTFYKNRAVRLFLNNLLAPVYTRIYNVRKWNFKALQQFFVYDAPLMNYQARKFLLVSFIVAVLGVAIGYFGARHNMDFAVSILGSDYINMTELNISKGDPLAVYKMSSPGDMFVRIATNNLLVAFYFFIFGALFCIGSMYLLLTNGIMLGVFTYIFVSKGLTTEYLLGVYQHGTLEILSMVVEGAAGIMMGAGFLFPGTKGRLRSIQDNAKKSILMFLVCLPIIILAAFIESFLTRFTELPAPLRLSVIGLSLAFMILYFIVYPWYKFRHNKEILGKYDELAPDEDSEPKPGVIYPVGKITLFAFDYLKKYAGRILIVSLISVVGLFAFTEFLSKGAIQEDIEYQARKFQSTVSVSDGSPETAESQKTAWRLVGFDFYASGYLFSPKLHNSILLVSFLILAAIIFLLFYLCRAFIASAAGTDPPLWRIALVSVFCAAFQVFFNWLFGSGWWFSMMLILPVQILIAVVYLMDPQTNIFTALGRGVGYFFTGFGTFISYSFIAVVLYFFLMTGIMYLVSNVLEMSTQLHGASVYSKSVLLFYARLNYFLLPFFISMVLYAYILGAMSIVESKTGKNLFNRIAGITYKKEVYGIETE